MTAPKSKKETMLFLNDKSKVMVVDLAELERLFNQLPSRLKDRLAPIEHARLRIQDSWR